MQPGEHTGRFRALDGLRGLFAVSVAALHCNFYGYFYDWPLVRSSYLAVDFFFVLSGFVISHASLSRLTSPRALATFLIRRFGRVWPLHVALLACFVALELAKWLAVARGAQVDTIPFSPGRFDPLAIPAHVALVHALHLFPGNTWNSPSWSISTEFYTYLLFALFVLSLRRWMVQASLLLIAACVWGLFLHVDTMDRTYDWALPRCVFGFFVGHLVYRVYARKAAPRRAATASELALVLATAVFILSAASNQLSILAPLVFAIPIWYFAFERGALSRVLSSRPLQALGRWSYAIYMVHDFVFLILMRMFRGLSRALQVDLFVVDTWTRPNDPITLLSFGQRWWMDALALLAITTSVGVAALAHKFLELPAQTYFQRLAKRLESRAPDSERHVQPERSELTGAVSPLNVP